MKFWPSPARALLLLSLGLVMGGCFQTPQSQLDEERESHFQTGKSRVNAMDYRGAIEAFETALEVNPRSASAHFELGWLFDQKESDPAAAIYHYQEYLKLRPKAENAGIVRQRILACKQQLASTVSLAPVTEKQQRDLERLADETKNLREENRRLRETIGQWQAYYARQQNAARQAEARPTETSQGAAAAQPSRESGPRYSQTAYGSESSARSGASRTHIIKPGETLSRVSRQYGVSLSALEAANPGLEPRRLRPGIAVRIPASGRGAGR